MEPVTRTTLTTEQMHAMRAVDNPGECFFFPEQYSNPPNVESGERAFFFAIFERAVDDIKECAARLDRRMYRRRYAKTLKWFRSGESHWPCAFENVCHVLGFDASQWRRWAMSYVAPTSWEQPAPEPEPQIVIVEDEPETISLEEAEEEGVVQIAVGA